MRAEESLVGWSKLCEVTFERFCKLFRVKGVLGDDAYYLV